MWLPNHKLSRYIIQGWGWSCWYMYLCFCQPFKELVSQRIRVRFPITDLFISKQANNSVSVASQNSRTFACPDLNPNCGATGVQDMAHYVCVLCIGWTGWNNLVFSSQVDSEPTHAILFYDITQLTCQPCQTMQSSTLSIHHTRETT